MMIALFCFLKLAEDLFQASFANSLLCFWCDLYFAKLIVICYITFVPELLNKITNAIFVICKLKFFIKLTHPAQCLGKIAIGICKQLHEHIKQLLKPRLTAFIGIKVFE